MEITYLMQPPKRYTFEQPKLKAWIESHCVGKTLNLFAGKTLLENVDEFRVDIDPNMPADYYGDAYGFVRDTDMRFDCCILDPPFGVRKAREKYEGRWIGSFTRIKNMLPQVLNPGGRVITLGYSSVGMSKSRGFEKVAICLICNSGDHSDMIAVVEDQIQERLD